MVNKILDKKVKKLIVFDEKNKKEIAVITHDKVITSEVEIVVKLYSKDKN